MANPNILNVATTYGAISYLIPTGTAATTWTALTPATNAINHISTLVATNVTTSPATITISINSATGGGGTAYRLAYQAVVPATASLIISDRSTAFYVGESQSIVVTSGTSNAIELTANYETLTAAAGSTGPTAAMIPVYAAGSVGTVSASYLTAYTQQAIFGYGTLASSARTAVTNKVSNIGTVSGDTTGVGTARSGLAGTGYGGDKAIFAFGYTGSTYVYVSNLVSNSGVVSTDTSTTGSLNGGVAAVYGYIYGLIILNDQVCYITSTGSVGANTTTSIYKNTGAMASYGTDKALYGFGFDNTGLATTINLISNTGTIASNSGSLDQPRSQLAAAGYGGDKAIFGYGQVSGATSVRYTNLVSNTGVVASYSLGVGTARISLAAAGYGGDQAIFGYGTGSGGYTAVTNKVSNTGVVSADTTGVGSPRVGLAAAGFSYT